MEKERCINSESQMLVDLFETLLVHTRTFPEDDEKEKEKEKRRKK